MYFQYYWKAVFGFVFGAAFRALYFWTTASDHRLDHRRWANELGKCIISNCVAVGFLHCSFVYWLFWDPGESARTKECLVGWVFLALTAVGPLLSPVIIFSILGLLYRLKFTLGLPIPTPGVRSNDKNTEVWIDLDYLQGRGTDLLGSKLFIHLHVKQQIGCILFAVNNNRTTKLNISVGGQIVFDDWVNPTSFLEGIALGLGNNTVLKSLTLELGRNASAKSMANKCDFYAAFVPLLADPRSTSVISHLSVKLWSGWSRRSKDSVARLVRHPQCRLESLSMDPRPGTAWLLWLCEYDPNIAYVQQLSERAVNTVESSPLARELGRILLARVEKACLELHIPGDVAALCKRNLVHAILKRHPEVASRGR